MKALIFHKIADKSGEEPDWIRGEDGKPILLPLFDEKGLPVMAAVVDHDGAPILNQEGAPSIRQAIAPQRQPWPLVEVVLDAPPPDEANFTPEKLYEALAEGWASIGKSEITFHLGRNEHFEDGDLTYTIARPPGRYPDASEPTGERQDNFFYCTRAEEA